MNRWGFLNILLGGILAILLVGIVVLHTNTQKRNGYLLEGMVTSPASGDYAKNGYFANGQTLQDPVEGSLARNVKAVEASNPFKATPEVLERGEAIFKRDCMACHGADAQGNGTVVKKGFPPPPSLLSDRVRHFPDSQIFHIITTGGAIMPSYAAQVAADDRWKVVLYLRSLLNSAPKADKAPAAEKAAPAWPGIALIGSNDCLACHAVDHKLVGPAFKDVAARYHGGHLDALVTKVKNGGSGNWGSIPMPPHPSVSVEQLRAIITQILALDSKGSQGGVQ